MEIESSTSLGGTIILLALFEQNLIFGQGYKMVRALEMEGWGRFCFLDYTPLFEKGIKETQNKPIETTWLTDQYSDHHLNDGPLFRCPAS